MIKHIAIVFLAAFIAVVVYMIGCSHTSFEDMGALCEAVEDRNGTCTPLHLSDDPFLTEEGHPPGEEGAPPPPKDPRKERVETTYTVQLGEVDIIFVVDNSSSMSKEHRSLSKQMDRFLDKIQGLSYRIAVITTDISSSPGNPNRGRPFQDGKFIKIGGKDWLEPVRAGDPPRSEDVSAFLAALVRPETLECDKKRRKGDKGGPRSNPCNQCIARFGQGSARCASICADPLRRGNRCVSTDERGIYALNLAVENRPDFHRPDAHFMAVFLSDEDVRSSGGRSREHPEPEEKDLPLSLVETIYHRLGGMKTFSAHAIIIPPGDDKCLDEQLNDIHAGGRGYTGEQYAKLAEARDVALTQYGNLLQGKVMSICDRNYDRQLAQIDIYANVPRVSIGCEDPVRVRFFQGGKRVQLRYEVEEAARSLVITDSIAISDPLQVKVVCEVLKSAGS